jgi:hypothetical protein
VPPEKITSEAINSNWLELDDSAVITGVNPVSRSKAVIFVSKSSNVRE